MAAKGKLKRRIATFLLLALFFGFIAVVLVAIRLTPKPMTAADKEKIAADQTKIEQLVSQRRLAAKPTPKPDANDTTAILQAKCNATYIDIIAAIDRLGSRSQLTTDTQARNELIRLARELGKYYDHRMTISPDARIHKPHHVQILFDLGRIIMQGDSKYSLLTCVRTPYTPEFRKQMNDAEPIAVLKTKFEDAAKMYYVLDLSAPFTLEQHDSSLIGDSPVMRATQNLLELYGEDPAYYGPLLKDIDPELVARRRAPDLAPMLNEMIESSVWVSQQYYDRTATWDKAADLYREHIDGEVLAQKIRLVLNPDMLFQLWNRDELRVNQTEWLADVASRANSIHNWSDLQSPTNPRTDPDAVVGDEAMTNALSQIQQARLQAAALEIIQGKAIPDTARNLQAGDMTPADSYFYNCYSQSGIGVFPAANNGDHAQWIGLNSYAVWNNGSRNYMQQSNGVVWFKLPPDHPALCKIK